MVAEHAAHDLDVIDTERRAAGGDRGRDAREVAGHDIRVALDDHDLLALGDVAAREIESVEHLRLVEDERLGGVEVLGALIVVEQLAGAEADGLPRHVADRPDHAAPEAVVGVAAVTGGEQARGDEIVLAEPLLQEGVLEGVERLGGVAHAEALGRGLVEAPAPEEVATGLGPRLGELGTEELLGGGIRRQQTRAGAVIGGRGCPVLVVQLDSGARRHALHGLLEAHVIHALQEGEDVTVFAASEAVVATDAWTHVEARTALLVERAETLERADTGRFEGHVVAHDVGDVDAGPDLVDIASTNETGHALILGSRRPRRPGARFAVWRARGQAYRSCQALAEGSVSEAT
ncbi:hypothetical protein GCM10025869_28620 [Homoserinibacter gongjuensis]|uniref:Uncharacterized protein n=1 Tax=Homoserinibacter gongjuensis TaxID=1162968 RepID=A0ABQ6JVT1_9MICO|nr:hypothetical protein GCM10025869_28620 [Homoserinibacter gongjuensis]